MVTTAPLWAKIFCASASVSSSSFASGATRLTRPHESAVPASMRSPVSSISIARLRGRLRDTPTPGVVQKMPLLIPGSANCATSLATARSHIDTSWQPAATATPCTRAITGCGSRTSDSIARLHCSNSAFCHFLPGCSLISRRSWPAQKCFPAPASTTTLTASSSASRSSSSWSAASIAVDSGFMRSPRLRVSVATPPWSDRRTYGATTSLLAGAFMSGLLLDRFHRSRLLSKDEFLDFARRRLRQRAEHHRARRLEAREVGAAMLDQLVLGDLGTGLDLDEGARGLAPLLVRLRDHGRGLHGRMAVEHVFHLERGDVLAPGDDDVLGAVLDLRVAVGLHHREVARVEPAAGERIARRLGVLQIALHRDVAAEHDLAHGLAVGGDRLHGLRIHHRQPLLHQVAHALAAVPLGAHADVEVLPLLLARAHRRGPVYLGQAVHVGQLPAHALHALDHRRGRRGSRDH